MKRNTQLSLLLSASLLAFVATGCDSKTETSNIPPPPRQPIPSVPATNVPSATPAPANPSSPVAAATATAPTTPGAAAAGGGPAVAAAPDAGFDAAKALEGYADVKKLGKNPLGDTAATADKGKPLFLQNCAPCHGQTGAGDGPAGMALDPKPRNQTAYKEYKYGYGDLGIFRTGKYGIEGTGMAGKDV
jgi:mono/diheme cytochrome c family protein